jgi:hypothetical protein
VRLPDNVQLTVNVTTIRDSAPDNQYHRVVTMHIGASNARVDLPVPAVHELIEQLRIAANFVSSIEKSETE